MKFYRMQTPTGKVVSVPQDEVNEALDNGGLIGAGEKFPVLSPDGQVVPIPSEELYEARKHGGKVATYKQTVDAKFDKLPWYKKAEIGAFTVLENIASTATFGGTDYLLEKIQPEGESYTEEKMERATALPTAATIGQIGGIFGGGAGAVGKATTGAISKAGSKAVSKAVAPATGLAVESAVAGAQMRAGEAPLESKIEAALDFEKIGKDLAFGTGLGIAFGAGKHALAAGTKGAGWASGKVGKFAEKGAGDATVFNTFLKAPPEQLIHTSPKMVNSIVDIPKEKAKRVIDFIEKNIIDNVSTGALLGGIATGGVSGALIAGAGTLGKEQLKKHTRAMAFKIADNIYKHPKIFEVTANVGLRGNMFLSDAAKKIASANVPTQFGGFISNADYRPTEEQLRKFYDYTFALNSPSKAVEQAKNGNVNIRHIEALQQVFPEQWNQAYTEIVTAYLDKYNKQGFLSFEDQNQLAKLGLPYNFLYSPEMQLQLQQLAGEQQQPQQPAPVPTQRNSRVRAGQVDKVKVTSNVQTDADYTTHNRVGLK